MTTWKVARPTRTCALSGKPLPPDAAVVTALFGAAEEVSEDKVRGAGLVRKDFLVDGADAGALEAALKDAFCVWRTKTAPLNPAKAHRLDFAFARELLERLRAQGDPSKAAVVWTLAMLLARKRHLTVVAERDGELELRWPRETDTFRVPSVVVTEAEQESLQQELARLFEF